MTQHKDCSSKEVAFIQSVWHRANDDEPVESQTQNDNHACQFAMCVHGGNMPIQQCQPNYYSDRAFRKLVAIYNLNEPTHEQYCEY